MNAQPVLKEHQIQGQIVDALRAVHLTVRETTAYRQKGSSGVDKGIPDLLIYSSRLPGVYIGLEIKRPGGRVSREQQEAVDNHEYEIANDVTSALMIVRDRLITLLHPECEPVRRINQFLYALNRGAP